MSNIADVSRKIKNVYEFKKKWDTCPSIYAYNDIKLRQRILGEYSRQRYTKFDFVFIYS